MANPSIAVFCGASFGNDPKFAEAARAIGAGLAEMGATLVYGGGTPGLMGEVAKAAQAGGAPIQGIIPAFLQALEAVEPITPEEKLIVTPHLQERILVEARGRAAGARHPARGRAHINIRR